MNPGPATPVVQYLNPTPGEIVETIGGGLIPQGLRPGLQNGLLTSPTNSQVRFHIITLDSGPLLGLPLLTD